jgi:hypothetical protein
VVNVIVLAVVSAAEKLATARQHAAEKPASS